MNVPLYRALRAKFGEVFITNAGIKREERIFDNGQLDVIERGEHYQVCCPFCDDTRNRLSVSYKWLTRDIFNPTRIRYLIRCYNEGCSELYEDEFVQEMLKLLIVAA